MYFYPWNFFNRSDRYIYKDNFFYWSEAVWLSLTGNFDCMGFLDYAFGLPFLIKLACIPKSPIKGFLRGFSNFLSYFKHLTALLLTIVCLPLSYLAYQCAAYKGRRLEKGILEIEILPVNEKQLEELDYSFHQAPSGNKYYYISDRKLHQMFFKQNYGNRIKLKNYHNVKELTKNRMERYILKEIEYKNDEGNRYGKYIFGLYPCTRLCEVGSGNSCGISGEITGPPVAFIVPSKDNKKEILAMKKMNAFFISEYVHPCYYHSAINSYIEQDAPFKAAEASIKKNRLTIQFALQQAAQHIAKDMKDEKGNCMPAVQIDALIPQISHFTGFGNSAVSTTLSQSSLYRSPREWITPTSWNEAATENAGYFPENQELNPPFFLIPFNL